MRLTEEQRRYVTPHMTVGVPATRVASAQSLSAMGNRGKANRDNEIADIVIAANRNGILDLSGREIQQRYEAQHVGKRIDTSTISGSVNRLVAAKRLVHAAARPCTVTGRNIVPVRSVAAQARLVG